ncbi:hypothetical protein ACLI4A_11775, partial [Pseudomonas aeruginosa]
MHARRLPRLLPLALAFLLSPAALAADTPAAELLRPAEAERPAHLDTPRQLVAGDAGNDPGPYTPPSLPDHKSGMTARVMGARSPVND